MAVLKSPRTIRNKKIWANHYRTNLTSSLYMLGTLKYPRLATYGTRLLIPTFYFSRSSNIVTLFIYFSIYNTLARTLQTFQFSHYGHMNLGSTRFRLMLNLNLLISFKPTK